MKNVQSQTSSHWIIGGILLVTGALMVSTLVAYHSQAQTTNGPTNANVNIDNLPPTFSGARGYQTPQGGTESYFAEDATLSGVIGGATLVVLNVNVTDLNGYPGSNIAVVARLGRSTSGGTAWPTGNFTNDTQAYPKDGSISCTDVATLSNTEHTWRCAINMQYLADATTEPMSPTVNFTGEKWAILHTVIDNFGTSPTATYTYEWPGLIGLETVAQIFLGAVPNDGTPTGATLTDVYNKGNVTIDLRTGTDKATDAAAWACTGGGYPLVSDLHHSLEGTTTDYDIMDPMTLSSQSTLFSTYDLLRETILGDLSEKSVQYNFATTQSIGVGVCTLSSIVLTAIQGF